ncbi:MAG: hypothetical protein ABL921_02730 [Pirellula sp.]
MFRRRFTCSTLGWLAAIASQRSSHSAFWSAMDDTKQNDADHEDLSATELAGARNGPWRRLFLDSTVVEERHGLERVFHAAQKHAANPVLVADRPWEGTSAITGPYVYGTVMKGPDRFRIWYQVLFQGNHVGYAESTDGIVWHKNNLDVIRYQGSPTNLVVSEFDVEKTGGRCHNPSVIVRPREADPMRRYALYGFDGKVGHPRVAFSPDGVHWRYPDESLKKPLFRSSDVVNFGFDPYTERYYCTWKTRTRRGRAVGIAWSADGQEWTKPIDGPVFVADDMDPSDAQIYGMPAFAYQGLYLGLPWIYRARYFRFGEYSVDKMHEAQSDSPRNIEVQLAWSWDLVNWTRPRDRKQFIPLGAASEWDRGMIVTARAPIVVGDLLYFYYGGTDRVHDEKRVQASIGLATLRLDGFCSMATQDETEGWLITRREPFQTPVVTINGRTKVGGSISAEILDRKNRVVPGFSRGECIPFAGDSVRHDLRWNANAIPETEKRGDYKIRFWLNRAELFSYLPKGLSPSEADVTRIQSSGP